MKENMSSNKMIWAIDPLMKNSLNLKKTEKFLSVWQKKQPLRITPLSIVTPEDLNLPFKLVAPWGEKLTELTEKAVKPVLNRLSVKGLLKPEVIMSTKQSAFEDLMKQALLEKNSLILVTTHEKKGAGKNRIGRFAQKLIEKSTLPVLTLRPSTQVPNKIEKVLFPTDFSQASLLAYKQLLKIARPLGAKIILYHNIYEPVLPAAEITGVGIASSQVLKDYVKEFTQLQQARSNKWIRMAHKAGVTTLYKSERGFFSLGRSILEAAKKEKVHMLVMGIESHPLLRATIGSAVHEVISSASQPVMVINTRLK